MVRARGLHPLTVKDIRFFTSSLNMVIKICNWKYHNNFLHLRWSDRSYNKDEMMMFEGAVLVTGLSKKRRMKLRVWMKLNIHDGTESKWDPPILGTTTGVEQNLKCRFSEWKWTQNKTQLRFCYHWFWAACQECWSQFAVAKPSNKAHHSIYALILPQAQDRTPHRAC